MALPFVVAIGLAVRNQAYAKLDAGAAREALLAVLASAPRADAGLAAVQGAQASETDAAAMDAAALAYIKAVQRRDYKSAWELVHPDARGTWTFETWQSLRKSMEPSAGEEGSHSGMETVLLLMGKKAQIKELITRGMSGMARVGVTLELPARLALRKAKSGGWAVDLAATDDAEAFSNAAEQLAAINAKGRGGDIYQMMMMSELEDAPSSLGFAAAMMPEATYTATSHGISGDRGTVAFKGTAVLDLAVPLANGDEGWSVAWCRGIEPFPAGKSIAQYLDEEIAIGHVTNDPRNRKCQENLEQISQALSIYAQEHEGRFPPAATWQSAVRQRVRGEQPFVCPTDSEARNTSYAFNYKLSAVAMPSIPHPADTFTLFESDLHVPNAYDKSGFPGRSLAVPGRHQRGSNYAFADGHVKWLFNGKPPGTTGPSNGWWRAAGKPPYPDKYRIAKTNEPDFPWLRPGTKSVTTDEGRPPADDRED
jgi:prepilin-type processing-associated H-X9-DG protein